MNEMDNCRQLLCGGGYKNTKVSLFQEPPKFLLKPPPLPPHELLNSSFYFLNNKCDLFTKSTKSNTNITLNLNNNNNNSTTTNNDYNLFIILLYSSLILFSILIFFAIIYLVLTRKVSFSSFHPILILFSTSKGEI